MNRQIEFFTQDSDGIWMAGLACGHYQHIWHRPPFVNRPWIETEAGRKRFIGFELVCKKCVEAAPREWHTDEFE